MFIVIDAIGPMTTVTPGALERMLRRGECVATDRPEIFRFTMDHIGLRPRTGAQKRADYLASVKS